MNIEEDLGYLENEQALTKSWVLGGIPEIEENLLLNPWDKRGIIRKSLGWTYLSVGGWGVERKSAQDRVEVKQRENCV